MAGKRGRPTKYTKELADKICAALCDGETLRAVCEPDDMPKESTVRQWARDDVQGFHAQYVRARELGYLKMADDITDIADDGRNDWMKIKTRGGDEIDVVNREAVERSKLRVDARKWLLSKALPKIYGDKLDVNAKHEAGDSFKKLWGMIGGGEK